MVNPTADPNKFSQIRSESNEQTSRVGLLSPAGECAAGDAARDSPAQLSRRKRNRQLFWIVAVALLVRLVIMCFFYHVSWDARFGHWYLGYEEGRVARAIAQGHGFSDPLWGPSGPTAWYAPIFPCIFAGVFRVFGVFTLASCLAILTFDAIVASLTCLPIFFFARRTFSEGAAFAAAWAWVFYPYSAYWSVIRIWETWLATLLLAILFCMSLNLQYSSKLRHWIGFGILAGLAALTDTVVLAVLPVLALWAVRRLHRQHKRWLAPAVCSVLAAILVISPWVVRNAVVFHKFIPIRDNLALEFRVGNSGNSEQTMDLLAGPWLPWVNDKEWKAYQSMGEIAYFHWKGQQVGAYIKAHPFWFAGMIARRIGFVWTGFWSFSDAYERQQTLDPLAIALLTLLSVVAFLGLFRAFRKKGAAIAMPYCLVLVLFPVVYYLTHVERWYRCPIDPFLIALAAYEVHSRSIEFLERRRNAKTSTTGPPTLFARLTQN